ncbi:MAG: helix-turn-helix domain-containing protein [Magnetococcus sp. YQC-9]
MDVSMVGMLAHLQINSTNIESSSKTETVMLNFSDRLKIERKRLGFTQDELAKVGDISKTSYFNYESGSREPSSSFLIAIATAGVDVNYLLTGVRFVTGRHASDFQDCPEIGTALVLDVVLFIEQWLTKAGKSMPPDKKVQMIKALCKFLVAEERKRPPAAQEPSEDNVIRMENFTDFLKAASS